MESINLCFVDALAIICFYICSIFVLCKVAVLSSTICFTLNVKPTSFITWQMCWTVFDLIQDIILFQIIYPFFKTVKRGLQWLSGRMLGLRLMGCCFELHWRYGVVS